MPTAVSAVLALLARQELPAPALLALDGHSASGKSSLARDLHAAYPASTLVHADDFYRPLPEPARAGLDAAGGYRLYYDWQRLAAQVLRPLSQGQPAHYQRYDWSSNRLAEWIAVPAEGLVIVEGCYAARPELRAFYHAIVIVVTGEATRQQRQRLRADATQEWLDRWEAAERYYMEHAAPQTYADLVVPGE